METRFENRFIPDEGQMREIFLYNSFHISLRWPYYLLGAAIIAFFTYRAVSVSPFWWAAVAFFLIWLPLGQIIGYRKSVKTYFTQLKIRCGGEILPEIRRVTEDTVLCTFEGAGEDRKMEVALSRIRRAVLLRGSVLLISQGRLMINFDRSGFTEGTETEFIAFLKAKGIPIRNG